MPGWDELKSTTLIRELDGATRAKFWGYASAIGLYKDVSCGQFIKYIDRPFLIMQSIDDKITRVSEVPYNDLMTNPYCNYIESDYGCHCDFYGRKRYVDVDGEQRFIYTRLYTDVVVKFLNDIALFDYQQSKSQPHH